METIHLTGKFAVTGPMILCLSALLSLAAIGRAAEPPVPPPEVDSAKFRETYAKWVAATEKVKKLEAQTYARKPRLRAVENEYARAQADLAEVSRLNHDAWLRYLDAHKDDPAVLEGYKSLMSQYSMLYSLEILSDPKKEAVLRELALDMPELLDRLTEDLKKHKPDVVKDWTDRNQVWAAFREFYLAHKADAEARLKRNRDQYKLPPEVEAMARANAIGRANVEMLYGLYIQHHTPAELAAARDEVKGLAGILTQLWPKWTEATTETSGPSTTP